MHLAEPIDLQPLKSEWLSAPTGAEAFVRARPPAEIGCLYYAPALEGFVDPEGVGSPVVPHFGRPGGVLPRILEAAAE